MAYPVTPGFETVSDISSTPVRRLALKVEIQLVDGDSAVWEDVTEYVLSASGSVAVSNPAVSVLPTGAGRGVTCVANITLRNPLIPGSGRLFSPLNTSSSYYGRCKDKWLGNPIRIYWGYYVSGTPEYVPLFRGYVSRVSDNYASHTVTFRCEDRSTILRGIYAATNLYTNIGAGTYLQFLNTYGNFYRDEYPNSQENASLTAATGTATSDSDLDNLVDDSKNWNDNKWRWSYVVYVYSGGTAGEAKGQVRRIKSNTSTTLTVFPNWTIKPKTGASYRIVYATHLDRGSFILPYAWCGDNSIWDEMNLVAASQGGVVFFDSAGLLRFEDMHRLMTPARTTPVLTLNVHRLSDITVDIRESEVYNDVHVVYRRPRRGPSEPLWVADEVYEVPKKNILDWRLDRYSYTVPSGSSLLPVDAKLSAPAYGLRIPQAEVDYKAGSGARDYTSQAWVTIDPSETTAQRVRLQLWNRTARRLYYTHLQVRGRSIYWGSEEEVHLYDQDSIDSIGRHSFSMSNRYIQTSQQAFALASMILDEHKHNSPILTISMPAVPYIEPGDIIEVQETATGINDKYAIHAISWEFVKDTGTGGIGGAQQQLTLRKVHSILDDYATIKRFFVLGVNTAGASSSNPGRYGY